MEKLLENGNSVIYDSCFCHHYQEKLKYYNALGYPYYIIRLSCREGIIKERLEKRVSEGKDFSIANYDDYVWMKNNVERVPSWFIDFTINTEEEIEPQVKEFLKTCIKEKKK